MIVGAVETVKRLPEREVANNIHSEPAEPVCQIGRPVTFVLDAGADLTEEGINIGLYERLLFAQGFLRESMIQQATDSSVVGVVCSDNILNASKLDKVFLKGPLALVMGIDVFPCRRRDERDFVRRHADGVTIIFIMQVSEPVCEVAPPRDEGNGDFGCCGPFGTRDFRQRMKVDVVYDVTEEI